MTPVPRLQNAKRLLVTGVLLAGIGLPFASAAAQDGGPKKVSATATLSILAGLVRHVPVGGSRPQSATDGMRLAVGDHVLTGPKSNALVTFLDGSTLTVMPESDILIQRAEVGGKRSDIRIGITLGMVWARVARLADPDSRFSLESNTATATVHDGLIGAHQFPDGSFICWTRAGEMRVEGRQGQRSVTLMPGEKTTVKPDGTPVPEVFAANQSVIRITAPETVLPLVLMAEKTRVAGFVAPGLEVNQVFGSFTGLAADGARCVEVPAGVSGPFVLILEGRQEGPFTVAIDGLYQGKMVYRQELSGTIRKGERFRAEINQQIDPATTGEPKMARVLGGTVTLLQPYAGPLPGTILLSPTELQAFEGR